MTFTTRPCPICNVQMVDYHKCFNCRYMKQHIRSLKVGKKYRKRMAATIAIFVAIAIFVTPYTHCAIASSETKLLKQILNQEKLQVALQQDNMIQLLGAIRNGTAVGEIANLYAQNAMVENHNGIAHVIQELQRK
jgi:hypothetical protein